MAEQKRKRKKTKSSSSRPVRLTERAFKPALDTVAKASLGLGGLGAALLGAGVYAQLLRETPHKHGSFILAAGALLLAAVILVMPDRPTLLVGDLGVGEDKGPDNTKRLRWCDVEKIAKTPDGLVVSGRETTVKVPLPAHETAAAWIVHEAEERMPKVVELSDEDEKELGEVSEDDGELRELEQPQLAGRRCRASGRVISYEPDARLCTRCGEVYHRESVPDACLACGGNDFRPTSAVDEESAEG